MTTPVYGVRIVDGKIEGSLIPIFVSVLSLKRNSESSYVTLSLTDEKIDKDDWRFLGSLPVSHPAGVIIDEDNWAGFFYHRLFLKDGMKMDFADKGVQSVRGCKLVSSHLSFGYYFFKIETLSQGTIGILVDRPEGTYRTSRRFNAATLIGDLSTAHQVQYNDEHIIVQYGHNSVIGDSQSAYRINFINKLTPEQIMKIYVEGINSISFTEELFDNHLIEYKNDHERERHVLRGRLPYDDRYRMIAHSFYGLEYIESLDKKVLIFLQKDPIRDALLAYRNLVSIMIDKVGEGIGEPEHLSKVQLTYQSLVDEYAIEVNTPDHQKEFLKKCLALLLDQV